MNVLTDPSNILLFLSNLYIVVDTKFNPYQNKNDPEKWSTKN